MATDHRYELRYISIDELAAELDTFWKQLQEESSPIREYAAKAGFTKEDLEKATRHKREDAFSLEQEGAGLGLITTTIIISSIPLLAKIAEGLWDKVFLPKIAAKYGANSVQPKNNNTLQPKNDLADK